MAVKGDQVWHYNALLKALTVTNLQIATEKVGLYDKFSNIKRTVKKLFFLPEGEKVVS